MERLPTGRGVLSTTFLSVLITVGPLWLVTQPAKAQWESFREVWRWARFTTESGLPSDRVIDVVETPNGTVWAVTQAGIAWYDGFRWTAIRDKHGIPALSPKCIAPHSHDSVLVVVREHLYAGGKKGFQRVPTREDSTDENVLGIAPYGVGKSLVLEVHGLYLYENNRLERIALPSNPMTDGQPNLWRSKSGFVWVSTYDGLYRWDGSVWSLHIRAATTTLSIKAVVEDSFGNGVAAVALPQGSQGLWEWSRGVPARRSRTERSALVQSLETAPNGDVFAAYEPGNIRIRQRGVWRALDPVVSEMQNTLMLRFRSNGDLWVGTEKGLFLFKSSSQRWTYRRYPFADLRNGVHEICRTSDGSLWLGTLRGLEIIRPDGGVVHVEAINGRVLNRITGILEDDDRNVWICSGASFEGAFRWDGRAWKHFGQHEGLDAPRVHKIRKDRRGRLWFLGMSVLYNDPKQPGAFMYENGRFERWGTREGLVNGRIYGFAETPDGALWFATYGGISRWRNGTWKHWTQDEGLRAERERINTLAADSNGTVWFANESSGLGYIDGNDEVHFLTTSDGLINNEIREIRVDEEGALWISTRGGLCSYRDGIWSRFDTNTGLITLRLWEVLPAKDKVYVGSPGSGLTILNRAEPRYPPLVDIARPVVDREQVLIRWSAYSHFGEQEPRAIETRYRVDNGSWSRWNTNREADLPDLSPGNHTVEVQAKGLFGDIQRRPTATTFEIEPRFYQRVGFLAPVAVLSGALLFLAAAYINRKRRAAAELRKSEERFQFVTSTTHDVVYDWDIPRNRIWFNDAAHTAFGNPSDGSSHSREWWVKRIHPDDRERVQKSIDRIIAQKGSDWQEEYRVQRADGSFVTILDRAGLLYDGSGSPTRWIGSAVDITEQKRAQEELRNLSKRILEAQENERRRVSRELHDSVNQILASAKFRVESLDEQIPRRNAKLRQEVKKTKLLMDKVMMEVRRISRNLRPSELDDLGLLPAIRSLAAEFTERTGIRVTLKLPGNEVAITPESELTLYRIIQEALTNIEKHSQATRIRLSLSKDDSTITVRIEDNGKGLSQGRAAGTPRKERGLGLLDMKERLTYLRGTLEISPRSPRGTAVEVRIPAEVAEIKNRA